MNLSFLGPIVRDTYQVSPRSAHVHQGEDNSDIDEEQVIPETQQERDKTLHEERDNTLQEERDNTLQEDHIIYNLPMKDISRENTDDYDDEYDSGDLQRSRSKRSTGQSRMSSIEAYRRASDFDQSRKISTDSHVERLSINRSRRSEVIADRSDGFNGGEKENMDFDRMSNVSHGSLHSTRSHNSSRSSVISYQDEVRVDRQRMREEIDRRRSSDGEIIRKRRMDNLDELIADNGEYLNDSFDAMYERHVAREGRWSEGHLLKERRPSYAGPGRYSEGHLVQGQGHLVQGKGERSFSQQGVHRSIENPPARSVSKRRSSISANNSIESSLDLTPSFRSRPPRDHDLESQGHGMSRSRQRETSIDEVDGYGTENSNLESRSKRQHVSGHRSFHGHDEEGHDVYVDNDDRISPSRPGNNLGLFMREP